MTGRHGLICLTLVSSMAPRLARAEGSRFFELEGFGHFLDGNPETTAVTEEGAIALPPEVHERFADAAVNFSVATGMGNDVVVARVGDAQVLAIDAAGHSRTLYKAQESMITALLDTSDGLLIAAAPGGKVYRLDKSGNAKLWYAAQANYVWGMASGDEGSVYLCTGEPAQVVKVDRDGHGKVLFHPEQAHLRSIAYDAKLGIFVGGGERGVLYRSSHDKDFRALYDTGHPEITAVLVRGDAAYVAGVTGAAALTQDESQAKRSDKPVDVRSQVVRVNMDGTSEVLAGSSDEAVFAMAFDSQNAVVVATGATGRDDPRGRIYSIDTTRRVISMLYQSPSRRVVNLVTLKDRTLAAVGAGGGRITQLSATTARKGEFFTQTFDTGITSRFGLAQVLGVFPKGTGVTLALRSGQTAEPDATWSDWSKEVEAPGNTPVQVSSGRYLQVRLTLTSKGETTPLVQRVRVAYLRQNLPPFVREVTALHKGVALLPLTRDDNKSKTIAINDKPDDGRDDGRRAGPIRARQVPDRGALTLKWVADDPNGDELRYELYVRAAAEDTWRLLKGDLEDPFFTLKSSQLPDGYYVFQVRASDARSNPDGFERSDSRESRAVLVDNTPPKVEALKVSTHGRTATVRSRVADSVGPLIDLAYALDGADPRPIAPEDGVLDGPSEDITIELHNLAPGRHTVTIRAMDEADNEGFGETTFEISP